MSLMLCRLSSCALRSGRAGATRRCAALARLSRSVQAPPRRLGAPAPRTVCRASEGEGDANLLMEMAALDGLIEQLLTAGSDQQLASIVAENIMRFDNKFWLRLATRNDTAASAAERDKLQVTATAVMKLVQAALSKTEAQLADSSKVLQAILTSAADENGEWYLPLTPSQVSAMRSALDAHADRLDEALLSNAFAWIRKCSEDGFDSMMALIQKMLQLYAGRALRSGATDGLEGAFNEVVYAEEREWAPLIMRMADEGRISEAAFMEMLQKRMEGVVLGMESGSYAQRVQAEYLKEVEGRAKEAFRQLAARPGAPQ